MDTLYTVYRTTNTTNGRYYIGVHKTTDPMDDYLGSGKIFKRALEKYGRPSFTKEILLVAESSEAAFALEFELVEKHREDPLCYNLRQGGSGGFDYINNTGLNGNFFMTEDSVKKSQATRKLRFETDPVFRSRIREAARRGQEAAQRVASPEVRDRSLLKAREAWAGSKHTEETKSLFSSSRKGEGNSHYGTRWMYKEESAKFVDADQVEECLKAGWCFGRKPQELRRLQKSSLEGRPRKTLLSEAPEGMTWCSLHKQYLLVEEFHRDSKQPSGCQKRCIECRKLKRKAPSGEVQAAG